MGDPPTVESGRTMSSKDPIMKCFVTDGSDAQLTGQVVIFFKVSTSSSSPGLCSYKTWTECELRGLITMGLARLMIKRRNPFGVMLFTRLLN